MIDASIYQNLRTPQVASPLETAGQALAIRNSIQTGAMNQERLRSEQLANRETELKRKDDQIATQTFLQSGGDPDKHVQLMAQSGARPQAVQGIQKHYADIVEQKAKTAKDQADADKYTNDRLSAITRQAMDTPDDQYAAAWPQFKAAALQVSPKLQLPDQAPDKNALAHMAALFNTNEILDKAADQKRAAIKAGQETTAAADTHSAAVAELPGKQYTSEIQQHKNDLYKTLTSSPDALSKRVAGSIDPQKYPAEYARALNEAQNAPDLEGINAAITKHSQNVSEREKTIATETDPSVMAARTKQALAIEQATNPLKLQQARAQAGATAGVREALKLDQDYVKSASATEQIGKVLDLADSGNKAAGQALSTVGAMSLNAVNGLKRLNRNEITGIGGESAGNAYDRVVGFFDKATAGQPIPENIRTDLRELHQSIGENAYKSYTAGLDSLSKRSGTTYGPTVQPPNIRKGGGTVKMRAPDGSTQDVPADQEAHYTALGAKRIQ